MFALRTTFCLGLALLCLGLGEKDAAAQQQQQRPAQQERMQKQRPNQQQQRRQKGQGQQRKGQKGAQGKGGQKGRRGRGRGGPDNSLIVGEVAPDFKIKSLDGKTETQLTSFKGKKPVVLIFGSYT